MERVCEPESGAGDKKGSNVFILLIHESATGDQET